MQDAFVALARQTTLPDHAAAWLHRVVRNAAVSALRGRKRRNQREARVSTHEAWFSSVDDQLDARNVTLFLADLDPETREVIVARLWGGLNFDQIARLQGSSLTTAHRRYQDRPGAAAKEAGTTMFNSDQDRVSDLELRLSSWVPSAEGLDRRSDAVRGGPGGGGNGRAGWRNVAMVEIRGRGRGRAGHGLRPRPGTTSGASVWHCSSRSRLTQLCPCAARFDISAHGRAARKSGYSRSFELSCFDPAGVALKVA